MAIGLTLVACDPTVDDKTSLGPVPNPTFDILQGEDANNFILKNSTLYCYKSPSVPSISVNCAQKFLTIGQLIYSI